MPSLPGNLRVSRRRPLSRVTDPAINHHSRDFGDGDVVSRVARLLPPGGCKARPDPAQRRGTPAGGSGVLSRAAGIPDTGPPCVPRPAGFCFGNRPGRADFQAPGASPAHGISLAGRPTNLRRGTLVAAHPVAVAKESPGRLRMRALGAAGKTAVAKWSIVANCVTLRFAIGCPCVDPRDTAIGRLRSGRRRIAWLGVPLRRMGTHLVATAAAHALRLRTAHRARRRSRLVSA